MTDLLELAARVDVAHEVETRALLEEAFPLFHARQMAAKPGFANWNPIWLQFQQFVSVKAFTDAAMLLVPDNWDHMEVYRPDHQTLGWTVYVMYNVNVDHTVISGCAQSYPLAILAAALRARAHGGGE